MEFYGTRGEGPVGGARAVVDGMAKNGGLYVPSSFPALTGEDLKNLGELEYFERCAYITSLYLTEFSYEELKEYTRKAYAKFDGEPAPVVRADDGIYLLELWHGPTAAFKDMALTVLPYLLVGAKKKTGDVRKTLILTATSGDTGKAALEGFKNVEGTDIIVLYPSEGVSETQKRQMITAEGKNVRVIGVDGNFDDVQKAVKKIFSDKEIKAELEKAGYSLSSANSINFGRLVPQIAYYVSAYVDLLNAGLIEEGEKINFVVPTGNFGNVLAAYYAERMGLPVRHLIVASNSNNVLTEFFDTGVYDANREFFRTISPSMDILISGNLERLIYEIGDRDPEFVKKPMAELADGGYYEIDEDVIYDKLPEFIGYFSTEEETKEVIDNFFDEYNYLLDPHTAVAVSAFFKYMGETCDATSTVIVSTANPYKFPRAVYESVSHNVEEDAFKAAKKLAAFSGVDIPEPLAELSRKKILHDKIVSKDKIAEAVIAAAGEML